MQLKALVDNVHQLQRGSKILVAERDQAVEMAAKATADAENAQAAKVEFMKAAKNASAKLTIELKKTEDLEAKVVGLRFEFETRSAELESRCSACRTIFRVACRSWKWPRQRWKWQRSR